MPSHLVTHRGGAPSPWLPHSYEVISNRQDNADTHTIAIRPVTGVPMAQPEPGQFMMLYAFGIGEAPISLSGIASDHLVHTIRKVGAVSAALATLSPGQQVGLRGPFGKPWPAEAAEGKDVILMAGGLGIAPLQPLIEHFLSHKTPHQTVHLLYGARDEAGLIYEHEVDRWSKGLHLLRTVDSATADWREHVGVVPGLLDYLELAPQQTVAYVCGPEVMMRFSLDKLLDMGLPAQQVFLSMERNMKCAVGLCGHCQFGGTLICRDGPVFAYPEVERLLKVREI